MELGNTADCQGRRSGIVSYQTAYLNSGKALPEPVLILFGISQMKGTVNELIWNEYKILVNTLQREKQMWQRYRGTFRYY